MSLKVRKTEEFGYICLYKCILLTEIKLKNVVKYPFKQRVTQIFSKKSHTSNTVTVLWQLGTFLLEKAVLST